jgi:hypothetical protein
MYSISSKTKRAAPSPHNCSPLFCIMRRRHSRQRGRHPPTLADTRVKPRTIRTGTTTPRVAGTIPEPVRKKKKRFSPTLRRHRPAGEMEEPFRSPEKRRNSRPFRWLPGRVPGAAGSQQARIVRSYRVLGTYRYVVAAAARWTEL